MARKNAKNHKAVRTSDGGTMTIAARENGNGFRIEVTRGYKETPEERRERMAAGNRARTFASGKQKNRGGRAGAKRAALREFA